MRGLNHAAVDAVSVVTFEDKSNTPGRNKTPIPNINIPRNNINLEFEEEDDGQLSPKTQSHVDALEMAAYVDMDNYQAIVFPWICPEKYQKKVTAVVTLPSGVDPHSCLVEIGNNKEEAIAQEAFVKFAWNRSFLDKKALFKTAQNKYTSYHIHPEAMAYEQAVMKHRLNYSHIPNCTIKIVLPIPVQTTHESYDVIPRMLPRVSERWQDKQCVLIIKMTGIKDTKVAKKKITAKVYESDDDLLDDSY